MDPFCYLCFVFVMLCSLVVICWERTYLLALLGVVFSCVFVTFPWCVLGQVLYLIVSIPDLCLLLTSIADRSLCNGFVCITFFYRSKQNLPLIPLLLHMFMFWFATSTLQYKHLKINSKIIWKADLIEKARENIRNL